MSHFRLLACFVNSNVDAFFLFFFFTYEYERKQSNFIVSCDSYPYNAARIIYLFVHLFFLSLTEGNEVTLFIFMEKSFFGIFSCKYI